MSSLDELVRDVVFSEEYLFHRTYHTGGESEKECDGNCGDLHFSLFLLLLFFQFGLGCILSLFYETVPIQEVGEFNE